MGIRAAVGSVKKDGHKAENLFSDVIYVRQLLNYHIMFNPYFLLEKDKFTPLPLTGISDMRETVRAIMAFQMYVQKIQYPSGCIEMGDAAIKELEKGYFPGKLAPDNLAPIEVRIHNKLLRSYEDDYLGIYDSQGEIRNLLQMLLENPKVDDRYIRHTFFLGNSQATDYGLTNYITRSSPTTPPGPIDFTVKILVRLKSELEKLNTTEKVNKFIANIAEEIRGGYIAYIKLDGQHALSLDPSPNGPYAASMNIEKWFNERFADKNSIYYCFPSIPKIRNAVDPTAREWWPTFR